jgi:mono/diheme cytochrome c family protein
MAYLFLLLGAGLLVACDKSSEHPPVSVPAGAVAPVRGLDPQQIQRGRVVYENNCAACHGPQGKGQPGDWRVRGANGKYPPPPLDDAAHAWHHPTAVLRKSIEEGSPPDVGNMPPWKGRITEQEIDDVIAYIKSLWSGESYRHWLGIEQRSLENG